MLGQLLDQGTEAVNEPLNDPEDDAMELVEIGHNVEEQLKIHAPGK